MVGGGSGELRRNLCRGHGWARPGQASPAAAARRRGLGHVSPHRGHGLSRDWSNEGRGNCGGSGLHRACLGLAGGFLGRLFLPQPLDQRGARVMADQLRFCGVLNDARAGTAGLTTALSPTNPTKGWRPSSGNTSIGWASRLAWKLPANRTANADVRTLFHGVRRTGTLP